MSDHWEAMGKDAMVTGLVTAVITSLRHGNLAAATSAARRLSVEGLGEDALLQLGQVANTLLGRLEGVTGENEGPLLGVALPGLDPASPGDPPPDGPRAQGG